MQNIYKLNEWVELTEDSIRVNIGDSKVKDEDDPNFLNLLKKHNVKMSDVSVVPGYPKPALTLTGKRKDIEAVLKDPKHGFNDKGGKIASRIDGGKPSNKNSVLSIDVNLVNLKSRDPQLNKGPKDPKDPGLLKLLKKHNVKMSNVRKVSGFSKPTVTLTGKKNDLIAVLKDPKDGFADKDGSLAKSLIRESVELEEAKIDNYIAYLKKTYSNIKRLNPNSDEWKTLNKELSNLSDDDLQKVVDAKIPWASTMAEPILKYGKFAHLRHGGPSKR